MLIRRDEHQIDKVFRKKLHDADGETPLHLWEGVRSNIRKKRRVPIFWWWLTGAAVIAGLSFFAYHQNENHVAEIAQEKTTSFDGNSEIAITPNQIDQEKLIDSAATETVDKEKSVASESAIPQRSSTSSSVDRKPKKSNPIGISQKKSIHEKSSDRLTIVPSTTDAFFDEVLVAFTESTVDPTIDIAQKASEQSISNSPTTESALKDEILGGSNQAWGTSPNTTAHPHWTENRFMVGAWYSMLNQVRKRTSLESSGLIDLNRRTNPETENGFGIGVGFRVWKGLAIWSGLEKTMFEEKHLWKDSVDVLYYNTTVNYEITYPIDSTIPVITAFYDTTVTPNREEQKEVEVNTYTSLNIPLYLSWQQPVYRGLFVSVETGPVFRVNSQYRGRFVFTEEVESDFSNLTADNQPVFQKEYIYLNEYYREWKMDWHAGLSVGWMGESGFGWNVGLKHRRMIGNTGSDHQVSHRIQSTGFNIGIQYRF